MFIKRTPEGSLINKIRERENEVSRHSDYKVEYIEKPGETLREKLVGNSISIYKCNRRNCLHCESKARKQIFKHPCTRSNAVYKARCEDCFSRDNPEEEDNKKEREEKKMPQPRHQNRRLNRHRVLHFHLHRNRHRNLRVSGQR